MIEVGEANKAGWKAITFNGLIGRVRNRKGKFEYETPQGRVGGTEAKQTEAIQKLIGLITFGTKRQGRPISNKHKVPSKMWDKWHPEAQKLFNELMGVLDQNIVTAPGAPLLSNSHWEVIRWNAAFLAATELSNQLRQR